MVTLTSKELFYVSGGVFGPKDALNLAGGICGSIAALSAFSIVLCKHKVLDKTDMPFLSIFGAYWTLASALIYCASSMIPSDCKC